MAGGLITAGAMFGLQAIGSGLDFFGQKDQTRQNNKAIDARNRYNTQMHGYGERIKDFEHGNALKIYGMRQKQAKLQNQEYDLAFANYFLDEQLQFDELVTQAKIAALQSNMQADQAQNQATASALNRGAVGRRAGVKGANIALMNAMAGAERARRLTFAGDNMDTRLARTSRSLNIKKEMAFNSIGPRPERAPAAPLPFMEQRDRGPSGMGLFSGLLSAGAGAYQQYGSMQAPDVGKIGAKPPGTGMDRVFG